MHCTSGDLSDFASNIHGHIGEVAVEPVTANARNTQQGQQGAEDKSMGHKDVYRVERKDGWSGMSDRSDSLTEILKRGELRHSRLLKMAGSGYTVDETSKRSREASEQCLRQSIQQLKANQQRESNRRSQVSKAAVGPR